MRRYDAEDRSSDWGRGTGKSPFSYRNQDLLREEEGGGKSGDRPETPIRAVPRPRDDALPYASDAKGKDTALFDRTLVAPNAKAWHALNPAQVRYRATTTPAVLLSKGERQAAARDPGLEWDETKRTYRPRRVGSPPPPLATSGNVEGQGGSETLARSTSQTGAGQ